MKTVLVTGIGGPTPRSIAKAIRNGRPGYRIIGVDVNPRALGFYMQGLTDRHHLVPRVSSADYWPEIKRIIKEEGVDYAFVQPEKEVLAWGDYLIQHGDLPCPALIPPLGHAQMLVDKAAMSTLLAGTDFIPKTLRISPTNPRLDEISAQIGYPCWIRASVGSGGLGSLKLERPEELQAWLFIHKHISEFTVSEFLTGRHLANQMLYIDGRCIKNAGLHCAEYVMADVAPSKVTGNTSYGLFINEPDLLDFCEIVMSHIQQVTGIKAHGVYSFDLKEDAYGNLKVTEINIRHMAYTGIMAQAGFDLTGDTMLFLEGKASQISEGRFSFPQEYVFLRDVDIEPILTTRSQLYSATES